MVATRRRRVVRTVSDFVISNESGGTSVKHPSKENTFEELPRKRRVVSRKQNDGDLLVAEASVQPRQKPRVFYVGTVGGLGTSRQFKSLMI